MFRTNALILAAVVSVLAVLPSSRAGVVIPDDLQPGDTYHLAFVTVGIRDALSSDIADYNQFVNDQAALSCLTGADMGVAWFAIASTATVDARDNAVVGFTSPVYLLDGTTRIADGFSDIWNASIANPLSLDQFLVTDVSPPWTGSESNGTAAGTPLGSGGNVRNGSTTHTNSNWISSNSANGSTSSTLYALSEELTVPDVVCPGTIGGMTSPANGTEDARQPYEPDANVMDAAARQGIGSVDEPIRIDLGVDENGNEITAVSAACFSLCDHPDDPNLGPNGIASVVDRCDGTYDIVLDFAIAPGAWTTISYGDGSSVSYLAHPANANADSFSNANDVLAVIDMLNGVVDPPFGLFSTDIDHSGAANASDILRVIDLLNGAGSYMEWLGVPKPFNQCG